MLGAAYQRSLRALVGARPSNAGLHEATRSRERFVHDLPRMCRTGILLVFLRDLFGDWFIARERKCSVVVGCGAGQRSCPVDVS
jgi:hypothetical protein